LLLLPASAQAQPEAPVHWSDWAITDPGEIRAGQLTVESTGKAYIAFLRAGGAVPQAPAPLPPGPESEERAAADAGRAEHAVWIWDTEARLLSADRDWMEFLQKQGVRVAFLQAPRQFTPALAQMVGELRSRGVESHALFGSPEDILPAGRQGLLAHVEQLRAFAPHFAGLHFDIELYLLPGFSGAKRNHFLHLYIKLVEELVRVGHGMGLQVGFALPAWFDQPPPFGSAADALVEVGGVAKLPFEQVLDRADNVALMSYRTNPGRVLEITAHERSYAAARSKKLWLGVETTALPDEVTYTFGGVPRRGRAQDNEVLLVGQRFVLGPSDETGLVWPVIYRDPAPARALSFAGLHPEELDNFRRRLPGVPLAFHDLPGWMKLLSRKD
jgi:hypothetical protein